MKLKALFHLDREIKCFGNPQSVPKEHPLHLSRGKYLGVENLPFHQF